MTARSARPTPAPSPRRGGHVGGGRALARQGDDRREPARRAEQAQRFDRVAQAAARRRHGRRAGADAAAGDAPRHQAPSARARRARRRCAAAPSAAACRRYPGGGGRYVRHRDAVQRGCAGRKLTVIYYLNAEWSEADGGCLRLWRARAPRASPAARRRGGRRRGGRRRGGRSAEGDGEVAPPVEAAPPVEIAPLAGRRSSLRAGLARVLPWTVAPGRAAARRASQRGCTTRARARAARRAERGARALSCLGQRASKGAGATAPRSFSSWRRCASSGGGAV